MDTYYLDPLRGVFQPERRQHPATATPAADRRKHAVTVGQAQYDFLRDCLLRREQAHDRLGVHERRTRHFLVLAAILFIVTTFAAPDFSVPITTDIVSLAITRNEIAAAFPIVISYLILFACYLGGRRLRMRHECRVLALELERFGCPTSYTVINAYYDRTCGPPKTFVRSLLVPGPYEWVFRVHDVFLFFTMAILITGGWIVSRRIFDAAPSSAHWIAWVFSVYLGISGAAAVAAVLVLRWVRYRRRSLLEHYEREVRGARGAVMDIP